MEGKNHPSLFSLGPLGKAPSKAPSITEGDVKRGPGQDPTRQPALRPAAQLCPVVANIFENISSNLLPKAGGALGVMLQGSACWPVTYLVLLFVGAHGQGVVGDLVGLVLLVGLQVEKFRPFPVFALNDGLHGAGLVARVGQEDGLAVCLTHITCKHQRLQRRSTEGAWLSSGILSLPWGWHLLTSWQRGQRKRQKPGVGLGAVGQAVWAISPSWKRVLRCLGDWESCKGLRTDLYQALEHSKKHFRKSYMKNVHSDHRLWGQPSCLFSEKGRGTSLLHAGDGAAASQGGEEETGSR